jgi:diadenosine tetraphosphate (Ap4A) HIT family hydrolase
MSTTFADFRSKFRVDELTIHQTEFWTWSVRPVHPTLGAGILSLSRLCPSFADLTQAEYADLGVIVPFLDKRLQEVFSPQKMNYLMLMMVDHHVHFHVIPRYDAPQQFGGFEWVDSGWPSHPSLGD